MFVFSFLTSAVLCKKADQMIRDKDRIWCQQGNSSFVLVPLLQIHAISMASECKGVWMAYFWKKNASFLFVFFVSS